MTNFDIESARRWIERNHAELPALEADPRNAHRMNLATQIRHEIARVERTMAQFGMPREQAETA